MTQSLFDRRPIIRKHTDVELHGLVEKSAQDAFDFGAAQILIDAGRRAVAQGDTPNGKCLSSHRAKLTENK